MNKDTPPVGFLTKATSGDIPWSTLLGVFAAVFLGIFLLAGTGFVGADVLHNAAHDVRHGMSFPCH